MKVFISFSSLIVLSIGITFAQNTIKEYTQKNIVRINSIDPDSVNFIDLETIGSAIGDANVVMLGEEDHGDAPTFLAKTRLIKYLHETKGFNVLAFESDFFGLNFGFDRTNKNHPVIDSFILKNVFPVWTVCNTCSNLFYKYIPETYKSSAPLVLTGFDSQQYLDYSFHHLKDNLDSVFRSLDLPVTKQADYSGMLQLIDSSKKWSFVLPKDSVPVIKCLNSLQLIKKQLASALKYNEFWMLVIDNLIEQVNDNKVKLATGKYPVDTRDIQMAKNLEWLVDNKFKGQKIIVWAANFHIAKTLQNFKFNMNETMGSRFVTDLNGKHKIYVLGFTSYQGTAGRIGVKQYKLYEPRKDSFENWVPKDYQNAFIDFKPLNASNNQATEYFYMAGLGHISMPAKWNHVYDGVFFIRDIYPCIRKQP